MDHLESLRNWATSFAVRYSPSNSSTAGSYKNSSVIYTCLCQYELGVLCCCRCRWCAVACAARWDFFPGSQNGNCDVIYRPFAFWQYYGSRPGPAPNAIQQVLGGLKADCPLNILVVTNINQEGQ